MSSGSDAAATAGALELAYRYLNRRERTTHELRQHLLAREVAEWAVEAAVEELLETGYLDDARFARLFVQDKRELQQWGRARIRRTLLSRGIEREIVEAALEEPDDAALEEPGDPALGNGSDELARALSLLRRRFPDPPRERRDQQRALGLLLRRGYEPELAIEALTTYARVCAPARSVLRSS